MNIRQIIKRWLRQSAKKKSRGERLRVEELEPRITPDTVAFGRDGIESQGLLLGRDLAVLTGSEFNFQKKV